MFNKAHVLFSFKLGCDSCIDDLLDEIEPETTRVTDAYGELSNISVGLLAVQRLQSLQEQVDAMEVSG